ncbi:transmembrane domain-containing protein [Cryptosporidium canis]|uniref:Transmembrane domain-containing protein n=1 Tax=Cryptosporidium canis TaxID=195482 RepID=A0A9D5DJI0_9CRYT|nr:transmembrane domain-containing protein [Cryptosporidium canis]
MNTIVKGFYNSIFRRGGKLDEARGAYKEQDIERSIEQHLGTQSELLKVVVFGGLDGIVTIFSLVSGCVAAGFTTIQLFTICMGSLLADAFAMSVGEYVSSKAEKDFVLSEQERERWEVENCPEEEMSEMFNLYQLKHGFSPDDAQKMVDLTFKYKEFFISNMMFEELGLIFESDGSSQPSSLKTATFMFFSFALFGLIPMVSFISFKHIFSLSDVLAQHSQVLSYTTACVCCALTLSVLGYIKGKFCNMPPIKSAITMLVSGLISGVVSYLVATFVTYLTS